MASAMAMNRVGEKSAFPSRPARKSLRVNAVARPSIHAVAGGAVLSGALIQASPALAEVSKVSSAAAPVVDVDSTIDQLIAAVKVAGSVVKSGVQIVGSGVETVKQGYSTAEPYLQQGYSTVAPLVKQAIDVTGNAVQPVISSAAPIIQGTVDDVVGKVNASGVRIADVVEPATSVAKTAAAAALPLLSGFARFVTTTPPTLLGEYALGAFAVYLLAPPLLRAYLDSLRGYAGDISASAAVDLCINGSATLVDLRSQREKEASGVPDLPFGSRDQVQDVEYALTEDRRLRGLLRDPAAIERQVTALQVAALRRVDKGSTLLLLDRYGGNSAAVARELAARGYGKVYVVTGGFDGRLGWVQSKLQVKPASSYVEPAARLAPAPRIGTRKQLMAPRQTGRSTS